MNGTSMRPTYLPLQQVPRFFYVVKRLVGGFVHPLHPEQRLSMNRATPLLPFCTATGILLGDLYLYIKTVIPGRYLSSVVQQIRKRACCSKKLKRLQSRLLT
jgi:hypothetical protein